MDVDGIPSGGVSYGHRFTHGEVEIAVRGRLRRGAARGRGRARRGRPPRDDRRRARRDRGWTRPERRVLDEVVYLVECPTVLEGSFDERFLALPERVVTTAMQSHQRYFPLGGTRFAFVANGGDPDLVRRGNERVLEGRLEDASFTFERDVAQGIEALAAAARHDHLRRGRGLVRRQDRAARRARRGARRRRRVARGGAAREGRPGRRARARVPRPRGPHRRRVRAAGGLPRGGLRRDRGAVPAGCGGRAAAPDRGGPRAGGGGQGRHPHGRVRARPAADRLARPVRPAPRGDRPLPARGRGGARDPPARARRPRPRAAGRPERRGEGRPGGRLGLRARAPRGDARRPRRVRARRPRRAARGARRRRPAGPRARRRRRHRGVRPRLRRVRPHEPPGGTSRGRRGGARSRARDRARRDRARRGARRRRPADRRRGRRGRLRDRARGRRRARARRGHVLRRRPRDGRRRSGSARTACGCSSTCATRSAGSATSRRSLARLGS